MPAITAANVTYTIAPYPKAPRIVNNAPPRYNNLVTVAFGDGALTYPTNGIPLTGTGLGMPSNQVEVVLIVDTSLATNTHLWTYDAVHNTLRGYSAEATELTGAVVATSLGVLAIGY
jgi:hypothetical protein